MNEKEEADRPWFASWFDRAEYEVVYGHRDDGEAAQLIDLIERVLNPGPNARVLDVGCGRGRHALQFASRGYNVTGVDLSENSIEAARRRATEAGLAARFEVGDMRDPFCVGCADIVTNLFTAFGYFEEEAEHLKAIASMANAAVDNGWFVQDFHRGT